MIRAITGSRPNKSVLRQDRVHTYIVGLRGDPFQDLKLKTDAQRPDGWVGLQPPVVITLSSAEPRSGEVESKARNNHQVRWRRCRPAHRLTHSVSARLEHRAGEKEERPIVKYPGKREQLVHRTFAQPIRLAGKSHKAKNNPRCFPNLGLPQVMPDLFRCRGSCGRVSSCLSHFRAQDLLFVPNHSTIGQIYGAPVVKKKKARKTAKSR